jgi:hypothetical protein
MKMYKFTTFSKAKLNRVNVKGSNAAVVRHITDKMSELPHILRQYTNRNNLLYKIAYVYSYIS